ncbi:outer membrane autotransporter barrel domain protein [Sphingopyxis sp. FD7]|jgi:hypothetical protein|nr:outer membrane autotransporter barrel domain protein [Sphingopyxis sp. FD7]
MDRLDQIIELQSRFGALKQRAHDYRSNLGQQPEDQGLQLLDTVETVSRDQLDTLEKLKAQIIAGNSFLARFTLWMSNRNAAAMERLMNKAEEDVS